VGKKTMSEKVKDYAQCIGFLVLFLFIIIGIPVLAFIRGYDRTIQVDKDAYISEYHPDANFGPENVLRVGRDNYGEIRSFYHFNISSVSRDWREAWIYVKFDYGTSLIDIGVYFTLNNWDEMTITWNNRPHPTVYKGHILCDGFEFRIPVNLDEIIDGGVSVCLCCMQLGEEGYIQGYSKEGASYNGQIAEIELTYTGFEPVVFWLSMRILILIFGIIGLIVLAVILAKHSKPIRVKRKRKPNNFPQDLEQIHKLLQNKAIANKIGPPAHINANEMMRRYYERNKPTLEKEINQYITLRLEHGKTFIYVNGRRFIQCIRLVLNIQKQDIPMYDEIESIDEAANVYKNHIYQNRIVQGPMAAPVRAQGHDITPEQEFWGHCSNLQAWIENNYDTRILMSNISFPLLRELSKAGDPVARGVYKEEIAVRLESGYPSVVQYLLAQGYIKEFTPAEFETLLESTDLIQKLSSNSRVLGALLDTCFYNFPLVIEKIILQILDLQNGEDLLLSFINRDIRYHRFPQFLPHFYNRLTPKVLVKLEDVLKNLINRVDEEIRKKVLNCVQAISERLSKYDVNSIGAKKVFLDNKFQLLENIPLKQAAIDKIKANILKAKNEAPSRCAFCGKVIPKGKDVCEWCGHKKDDDRGGGFLPHPFISKPPPGGGGGSMKAVAVVKNKTAA
jgi:hypothetical protein